MSDTLQRWMGAGLVEVDLPSGFRIQIRPVSPMQLVAGDLLPTELIAALMDDADGTAVKGELDNASGHTVMRIAARAVRAIWNGEAWEPLEITAEQLASGAFDPDDVDAIIAASVARLTAAAEKEGVGREDLAGFRPDGPGADDRPDGGAVRPAAELADRPPRAATRPRARRGARVPARQG